MKLSDQLRAYPPPPRRVLIACASELERLEREKGRACKWTEDEDGNWLTACGEAWLFVEAGPVENKMRFCPYCGGTLNAKEADDAC